jgi:hypothetical protein
VLPCCLELGRFHSKNNPGTTRTTTESKIRDMVAVGSRLTWNEGPVFGGGTLEKTSTDGPIDENRMQASEPLRAMSPPHLRLKCGRPCWARRAMSVWLMALCLTNLARMAECRGLHAAQDHKKTPPTAQVGLPRPRGLAGFRDQIPVC